MTGELPYSEACERNKAPILERLLHLLPPKGRVLEIGSGTGQHLVYFAPRFPGLSWQPTEQADQLDGLGARIREEGSLNILPPIELDVLQAWPNRFYDAVYSSNTSHIMAWREVGRMFAGVGERLRAGAAFLIYGPFNENGQFTADSNAEFDRQLRQRDPEMGLRDIEALASLAKSHQMSLENQAGLPANNQLLVFRKNSD